MVPPPRFVPLWAVPFIFFGMVFGGMFLTRPEAWSSLSSLANNGQGVLLGFVLYPMGILYWLPSQTVGGTLVIFTYAAHLSFLILFCAIRQLPQACIIWVIYALHLLATSMGWQEVLKQL